MPNNWTRDYLLEYWKIDDGDDASNLRLTNVSDIKKDHDAITIDNTECKVSKTFITPYNHFMSGLLKSYDIELLNMYEVGDEWHVEWQKEIDDHTSYFMHMCPALNGYEALLKGVLKYHIKRNDVNFEWHKHTENCQCLNNGFCNIDKKRCSYRNCHSAKIVNQPKVKNYYV
jgi:hypothetical protein